MTLVLIIVGIFMKHLIADWMFRFEWESLGKYEKTGWLLPLLTHCLIHTAFMIALMAWLTESARITALIATIDLVTHMLIDRLKAIGFHRHWGTNRSRTIFDQMLHGAVYVVIMGILWKIG